MKSFFKRSLVYLIGAVLVVPSWLVLDFLTIQKAEAFEVSDMSSLKFTIQPTPALLWLTGGCLNGLLPVLRQTS
jgi:hypothetical protein